MKHLVILLIILMILLLTLLAVNWRYYIPEREQQIRIEQKYEEPMMCPI